MEASLIPRGILPLFIRDSSCAPRSLQWQQSHPSGPNTECERVPSDPAHQNGQAPRLTAPEEPGAGIRCMHVQHAVRSSSTTGALWKEQ
ncbi:hypothetical protein A0H81_07384 [Grifola frondosa]|uniref:Uncharacterized protein n=1 Tax=Grifola frondosa TaxID=5627 RepID=A0A1C7M6C9_GRIFR|nr:hypothetical protein A0H81_07384 [Grifola frondosa]